MGLEEPSKGKLMREYNARVASIGSDHTPDDVRAILGEPAATAMREELHTPSDFFRQMGSLFQFPDDGTDTIWIYEDPYRPRVSHYVGFARGRVRTTWKETLTTERSDELKRAVAATRG